MARNSGKLAKAINSLNYRMETDSFRICRLSLNVPHFPSLYYIILHQTSKKITTNSQPSMRLNKYPYDSLSDIGWKMGAQKGYILYVLGKR